MYCYPMKEYILVATNSLLLFNFGAWLQLDICFMTVLIFLMRGIEGKYKQTWPQTKTLLQQMSAEHSQNVPIIIYTDRGYVVTFMITQIIRHNKYWKAMLSHRTMGMYSKELAFQGVANSPFVPIEKHLVFYILE